MGDREYGRVETVSIEPRRAALLAGTPAGAMALVVDDPVDFDETGGTLLIAEQVVKYTSVDDDTGTITLAAPLAVAADADDWVHVYDTLHERPAVEKVATVRGEADDDDGDTLEAVVSHALFDRLEEGTRVADEGELVALELDGDEWLVVNIEDQEPVKTAEHYVALYAQSSFNVPNSTWTLPTFGGGLARGFNPSTGPSAAYRAIWVITTPGMYLLIARATFNNNATGRREIRVLLNNTPVARANIRPTPDGDDIVAVTHMEECKAGDFLSVEVWQNSGGGLSVVPGTNLTSLRIVRL